MLSSAKEKRLPEDNASREYLDGVSEGVEPHDADS